MFFYLLLASAALATVHILLSAEKTLARAGEIVLLYFLVGYCGVATLLVSLYSLIQPNDVAAILGYPAGNPFQNFTSYALIGMSVPSVLALWYRGTFLVAPALSWATFFAGATFVHMHDHGGGAHSHWERFTSSRPTGSSP